MAELYEAQKNGNMVGDSSCLRLNEIKIRTLPVDTLPGHAAWLQWPWKLHRMQDADGKVKWELYNLQADSMEVENLVELNPERATTMGESLERWQYSVLRSQNGGEYDKTEKLMSETNANGALIQLSLRQ
jgi:hypothetical protein